jgi:membrane associated rhomboid family serine protease
LLPLKDNIPTRMFPVVTVVIIVMNVIVYFGFEQGGWSAPGNDKVVVEYSFIPYELSHTDRVCEISDIGNDSCSTNAADSSQPNVLLTILTAMFMHGSFLHLAGNMLFLWIFGNNIEDAMGKPKFLLFYLLGGIVASLAQFATATTAVVPNLGASGAIAAVLGGYALLYPRARVVTLIFIVFFITLIELPALAVLGGWFVLQLLATASQPLGGGGVAVWAHIGGFVFGLLAVKLFASRAQVDYERHSRLPVY